MLVHLTDYSCWDRYGSSSSNDGRILRTPSSWFRGFSLPVRITELAPPSTDPSSSLSTGQPDLLHSVLLKADIPIIIVNTMTTPISSLLKQTLLFRNPNAIILLTPIPTSQKLTQHLRVLLAQAGIEPAGGHESETICSLGTKA